MERWRRRVHRRGLIGRWILLRHNAGEFLFRHSAVYRDLYVRAETRKYLRKYSGKLYQR